MCYSIADLMKRQDVCTPRDSQSLVKHCYFLESIKMNLTCDFEFKEEMSIDWDDIAQMY